MAVESTTSLPPWLDTALQDLYKRTNTLSQDSYPAYTGPRISQFTPDQLASFDLTRASAGSAQPYLFGGLDLAAQSGMTPAGTEYASNQLQSFNPYAGFQPGIDMGQQSLQGLGNYGTAMNFAGAATQPNQQFNQAAGMFGLGGFSNPYAAESAGLTRASTVAPDQAAISGYMNPYTNLVIDESINELSRQHDLKNRDVRSEAATTGAFGGSRLGLLEAENTRNFYDEVADVTATQNQQNFMQALGQANFQQGVLGQAGAQLGGLGQGIGQLGMAGAQGLAGLSDQQRSAYLKAGGLITDTQARGAADQLGVAQLMTQAGQFGGSQFLESMGLLDRLGLGQQAAQAQSGELMGNLSSMLQGMNLQDIQALSGIGGQQQALTQANLDLGYEDFMKQNLWPYQQISFLNDILQGKDAGRTTTETVDTGSNIGEYLGLALGGIGLADEVGLFDSLF